MSGDTEHSNPNTPPVDRLSYLWGRVNEHKIVQWTVAYIAVAYALQQGLVLMGGAFDWPDGVLRASMLLLILGLPVVITLAWYHGERASRNFSAAELTIISLLLVIGAAVFYAFVQPQEDIAADQAPPAQQTGVEKARAAATSQTGAISVAVLPFENLSGDPEQEFFSAGMTEEITSALTKIPDLRVVARTSAFQFKDQKRDIQAIAQTLRATHFVEGSVRKAGARLRITAQLINAENGVSIWSETYDREYTDVFAIQEDIATAIAGAFRMPLGLRSGERLVNNRTDDLKAYEDYLRVRVIGALARTMPNARAILEEAVARAPGFAPAWASLADLYRSESNVSRRQNSSVEEMRRTTQAWLSKAEMAARKAIELDSRNSSGHAELGAVLSRRGMWAAAEDLYRRALELDPDNPEALHVSSATLATVGRLKESLRIRENLRGLEPFVPIYNSLTANVMLLNGQVAASIATLEPLPPDYNNRNVTLARAYAAEGQYAKAADTLLLVRTIFPRESVADAVGFLRSAPTKVTAPQELPDLAAELNFVYSHVGALERVMEYPERVVKIGNMSSGVYMLWDPLYAPLRKTERFKTLMRDAGLVDYWRERGWPDLCRPVGADDFVCD